jgi:phosphomannomutase
VSPPELPDIFKAYDIRGLVGEQIDGDLAELIGGAFAQVLARLAEKPVEELRVGLGRDMRLSAPELAGRYREGLLAAGVSVIDAGQVGSEMLYFLVGSRELDGGLMCTASHNPKAYTGAKLVREGALALSGDTGIQDIRRLIERELAAPGQHLPAAHVPGDADRGKLEEVDLYEEFQERALQFIDPDVIRFSGRRPLKVVVDGGNGMAGPIALGWS